ncbi:hypothetical protein [Streptomyces sp. NPDC048496]|uniref:hypothetical protein n=1 Tax=Streptomyces sp. NPDC048496 TaxID=3365558 RepID=UPI0037224CE1
MRHLTRSQAFATLGAVMLAALTGCSTAADADRADAKPSPTLTPAALPAPRSAPAPALTLTSLPKRGEVRIEEGPFTDRVRVTRLALTKKPTVTGHVAITSDVSDVLALELRAAYYDADGRLLGTGSFQYQEEGEDAHGDDHHDGPRAAGNGIDFTVPAKKLTGTPATAVVSIPVLVNE